ncbi:MAG: AMP-binding protein [Comamonadaceae bacterium]|nr:AMP-binding protein [Comamonadaceae bacterium]
MARAGRAGAARAATLTRRRRPQACSDGDLLLVYTSGTTGEPKGAHAHRSRHARPTSRRRSRRRRSTPRTRVLAVLPLFHVGGLCIQTLPALAAGGTVRAARALRRRRLVRRRRRAGGRRPRCWCRR